MKLTVDMGSIPARHQAFEFNVRMENMGTDNKVNKTFVLRGVPDLAPNPPIGNHPSPEVVISLDDSCKLAMIEIEKAISKRQREILSFFMKAKGVAWRILNQEKIMF